MNYANEQPDEFTPLNTCVHTRACMRAAAALRATVAADRVSVARKQACNVIARLMRACRAGFGRILIIPVLISPSNYALARVSLAYPARSHADAP